VQTNIYAQKDNGDLRLLAEVEGLDDPALAVDALLDEMPRLKQREFVVINTDYITFLEAGDEIVQPRRQIVVRAGNNVAPVAEETPAPKRRGRPRKQEANGAAENADNGGDESSAASRSKGGRKASPFRSNPASAE